MARTQSAASKSNNLKPQTADQTMNSQLINERPRFKTRAHESGFDLAIALPGVPRGQVDVTLEKNVLTVIGERANLEGDFEPRDHEAARYELKVTLHEDLDSQNIQASHHDGLLILALQKRKEVAPRKIDILSN